jgi:uncharacterized protein
MNGLFTLITGASEGIGRSLAYECAKRNFNVALVARSEDKLKEVSTDLTEKYGIKTVYYPIDISLSGSPEKIYEWSKKNVGINILINNAGIGMFGKFEKLDLTEQLRMISLNIIGLVSLSHLFIKDMKKLDYSNILNVASIAAFYPLPYYSVYGATKAFVLSFTEALRYELRETNINVSCICPGDTKTNFFRKTGNFEKKIDNLMDSDILAKFAVDGLLNHKDVIFPGKVKLIADMSRFFKSLFRKKLYKMLSGYKIG